MTVKAGWKEKFLEALKLCPSISAACRAANISTVHAYDTRQVDKEFAKKWKESLELALKAAEDVAWDRAIDQSDKLLMFMLRAHKPARYGEKMGVEVSGKLSFDDLIKAANGDEETDES